MIAVLAFSLVLLASVLVSDRAHRSVLSTAVLFLGAGFLLGEGVVGALDVDPRDEIVATFAELALFAVLFTDGQKVGLPQLRSAWRLPGQALALGLPLTLVFTAAFGHYVGGLPWPESLLLGAVLSPTDPVFAAAIVGREEIPFRLRHLLNVESGLNDGLALPVVIVLLAVVNEADVEVVSLLGEVVLGVVVGVAIPWVAIKLEASRFFSASTAYEPLNAFAIGLIVLAVASLTHANEFLAAFAAGVTVATMSPAVSEAFHRFGDLVAELLKLAALLIFGALISPTFLGEISFSGYVFAALALLVARPVAIALSFARSRLATKEWLAAAWFGPKGFASVVYGLIVLEADLAFGNELFHLIALVVVASILAHSSTDVLVARWFEPGRAVGPHSPRGTGPAEGAAPADAALADAALADASGADASAGARPDPTQSMDKP